MLLGDTTLETALTEKVKSFLPATQCIIDNEAPTLTKECLRISSLETFQSKESKLMSPELLQEIMSLGDPSKFPHHGANLIDHEGFYKKASVEKFGMEPGLSYKKTYLERLVADKITIASSPSSNDESDTHLMIEAAQDYIFTLCLRNISSSQLLEKSLSNLPNLMTLELQFGNKVNFDAAPTQGKHFGLMQASDAISLAIAVQSIPHLCSLSLTNSQMTDDLMRLFVNELKAKDKDKDKYNDGNSLTGIRDTLVELDLSFNKLTTDGFRQILLYFLDGDDLIHDVDDDDKKIIGAEDSILSTFKVAGNKIRAEGARTLGRILRTNASLEALDLRMNLLNDEGGQLVMNGLQHNHTLKRLNMSCNLLSSLTAEGLCRVFEMSDSSTRSSNQLQHMDISSNEFKASDLIMLSQAVEQTCKLTSLDLRGNVFKNSGSKKITTEDALESINNKLKSNATHMKMQNR